MRKDILRIALVMFAENFDRLFGEGVWMIRKRSRLDGGKGDITSLHLRDAATFMAVFGEDDYHFTEDGEYVYLIDGNLQFYAMVDDDED